MRLKTRLVKDPYRVKIMPPVQLVVMTRIRRLAESLILLAKSVPYQFG